MSIWKILKIIFKSYAALILFAFGFIFFLLLLGAIIK